MTPFATELAAARAAQEPWARLSVRDRLRSVRNLRALLVSRADDICAAELADVGRGTTDVVSTDLLPTAAALKFLEKRAAKLLAPKRISWWDQPTWLFGCRDAIHRRPWGAVGVIGTWNYPIYLNVVQIAQALVAGNAVLWKPSEQVPRTSDLTRELFRAAGFPTELLQVLPATREAGPRLAETDVDHVVFTGSDAVGRKLAARLGERLIPSTLELSGCDAMFVLDDADLTFAARAAWFGLALNRGQTCIAVRRVFVPRAKLEAFSAALAALVRGEPMPLVMEAQKAQAERLVADAISRGAVRLAGAQPTPPGPPSLKGEGESSIGVSSAFAAREGSGPPLPFRECGPGGVGCAPTFLLNVPADAALCREACFAPVAAIIPYDTVGSALSLAKQSPFGLSASIFTADPAKAKELAARVPSGSVIVNDVMAPTAHPAAPFGGRGASGWGVTQGADGLLAMTVPQVVTVHKGKFRPHFDEAANPDPATAEIIRGLLTWTHARGLRAKLRGLWQMVRGARKKK
ncbi:MAG: aldehyde dehydrogenase family protein [Planctomycetes bacterium]|nr:aldehyde dehydrogenase family protein [Planctomycetota bacterium]